MLIKNEQMKCADEYMLINLKTNLYILKYIFNPLWNNIHTNMVSSEHTYNICIIYVKQAKKSVQQQ